MEFERYMRRALALAEAAAAAGDVPVGCVVADGAGNIIGEGFNRREETRSVTGHAELAALDAACRDRGDWRLDDCTLFVTLEPCPMCAGAVINARVGTLVYGAREPLYGSAASIINLFEERYPAKTAIFGGVLAEESAALLKAFFEGKRGSQGVSL